MQSISFKQVGEINSLLTPMIEQGASLQVSIDSRSDSGVMYVLEGMEKSSAEMNNLFPPMYFWQMRDLLIMMYKSGIYEDYVCESEVVEPKHKGIDTLKAIGLIGQDEFVVTGTYPNHNKSIGSFHAIQVHTKFGDFKIRVSNDDSRLVISSGNEIAVYPRASNIIEMISYE